MVEKMHTKRARKKRAKPVTNIKTIQENNSSNNQDKLLQSRIDEFYKTYDEYNQILICFYNKNRFANTDHKDVEQFKRARTRLQKNIDVLGRFFENIDSTSFAVNLLLILQIKFIILIGEFDVAFNVMQSIVFEENAIKVWMNNYEHLHYGQDVAFQEVVFYTLISLGDYYDKEKCLDNHHNLLPVFAKKCPDNIWKLTALYMHYFPTELQNITNINQLSVPDRLDFEVIYNNTVLPLKVLKEQNVLDIKNIWIYIKANLLVCKFKTLTHPSSVWNWRNFRDELVITDYKKISEEKLKNSLSLFIHSTDNYIESSTNLFLDIDWKKLKQNAKWLVEIKELFTQWSEHILSQLGLYFNWMKHYGSLFEVKDLWNKLLDEADRLIACYGNIRTSFDKYLTAYPKNPMQLIGMDVYCKEIQKAKEVLVYERTEIAIYELQNIFHHHNVNVMSEALINEARNETDLQLKKKAIYRNNSLKIRAGCSEKSNCITPQHNDSLSEKHTEQVTINFTKKSDIHLENASQFLNKKKPDMAINSYQLALSLAEMEGDSHQQLKAIDGLGESYSIALSPKMRDFRGILLERIKSKLPLNNNVRDNLILSIHTLVLDYNIIVATFEKFKNVSSREDILSIKEIVPGVRHATNNIEKYLMQFQLLITDIKYLCYSLIESCKLERHRFIMQLGIKKLAKLPINNDVSDEEIYRIGKQEFARIGKQKKYEGKSDSEFSMDLVLFNNLAVQLDLFESSIISPSICVKLPDVINHTFLFLNDVSKEHFLVGSTVINLVLEHWNQPGITTHDVDFITSSQNHDELLLKGYYQAPKMNNLYACNFLNQNIELYCLKAENDWLMKSLLTRPFTITALCCDHNGFILDPTQQGIPDLLNKCIRMIGEPLIRFDTDPILTLLTIKFLQLGFEMEAGLKDALCQWVPTKLSNYDHLCAVARKHLQQFDRESYVFNLIEYGLLEKLFKLKHYGDIANTVQRMEETVNATHNSIDINLEQSQLNSSSRTLNNNRHSLFHNNNRNAADIDNSLYNLKL